VNAQRIAFNLATKLTDGEGDTAMDEEESRFISGSTALPIGRQERIMAGVILPVFGLNGFLNFIPLPPPGGIAGQFMSALHASHYPWVIFAFQVIAAVLLLVNRYVPLAVAVLAPVIVNIVFFHALMAPSGLPLALFVAVLWAMMFVDGRPAFAALFKSRLQARA
jgi:putative oxidoreductase